jgi:hypothetical protein
MEQGSETASATVPPLTAQQQDVSSCMGVNAPSSCMPSSASSASTVAYSPVNQAQLPHDLLETDVSPRSLAGHGRAAAVKTNFCLPRLLDKPHVLSRVLRPATERSTSSPVYPPLLCRLMALARTETGDTIHALGTYIAHQIACEYGQTKGGSPLSCATDLEAAKADVSAPSSVLEHLHSHKGKIISTATGACLSRAATTMADMLSPAAPTEWIRYAALHATHLLHVMDAVIKQSGMMWAAFVEDALRLATAAAAHGLSGSQDLIAHWSANGLVPPAPPPQHHQAKWAPLTLRAQTTPSFLIRMPPRLRRVLSPSPSADVHPPRLCASPIPVRHCRARESPGRGNCAEEQANAHASVSQTRGGGAVGMPAPAPAAAVCPVCTDALDMEYLDTEGVWAYVDCLRETFGEDLLEAPPDYAPREHAKQMRVVHFECASPSAMPWLHSKT